MGRPLRLDWAPGDTRIRQATYGVRYQSLEATDVAHPQTDNGCGYNAIMLSSQKGGRGSRVLSKENIGKIIRLSGYPNFIDGAELTPELIMLAYQYSVSRIKGSDMPVPLNQSGYMLDVRDGVVAKYRYCEMHPGAEAGKFNTNIHPGIFIIFLGAPGSDDGSWHIEAVTDPRTRTHIEYNAQSKNHQARDVDTEVSGADRMLESTKKKPRAVGHKRKTVDADGQPVGTTQLLDEEYLDTPIEEKHAERYVYPEPTERRITDGLIVEVDGTDITQFTEGGW